MLKRPREKLLLTVFILVSSLERVCSDLQVIFKIRTFEQLCVKTETAPSVLMQILGRFMVYFQMLYYLLFHNVVLEEKNLSIFTGQICS